MCGAWYNRIVVLLCGGLCAIYAWGEHVAEDLGNGSVVASDGFYVNGATTDYIELYSRKERTSSDAIARDAILVRYPEAEATVLICHGFMSDQHDAGIFRQLFPRGTFNCMTFNFRAHDPFKKPEGQTCTLGYDEILDVLAAVRFLRQYEHTKNKPVIAYGYSMGAVSLIEAQARHALFSGMILDCPFDSSQTILSCALDSLKIPFFGHEIDMPGKRILQSFAFHPYVQSFIKTMLHAVAKYDFRDIDFRLCDVQPCQSVRNITIPCFFIHCKHDNKVPITSIKRVFSNAAGYKKLWITNGRWHFDSYFYNPEQYKDAVQRFALGVLRNQLPLEEHNTIKNDPDDPILQKQSLTL